MRAALLGVAEHEAGDGGQCDDASAPSPGAVGDLVGEHPDAQRVALVRSALGVEHRLGDGRDDRLAALVVELSLGYRGDDPVARLPGRLARDAWQASGRPVLGAAVARRAANQLQADTGIATTSVAALLAGVERDGTGLPNGAILIVDEAAMVATRQLARLLDAVERAEGKLVLVGDHRQLPEFTAGGVFRALVRRGLAVELMENRRQREEWERKALDQLRDGNPELAIALYVAHERIRVADTPAETRERLVREWHSAQSDGVAVMIAQRRTDVADLNRRARAVLRASG
ncbi:MAG: AAA family ATPase, partial [Solirubrobacteraceae bacterium]